MAGRLTRRAVLAGGAALAAVGGGWAVEAWRGRAAYGAALARMHAPLGSDPGLADLVRMATLAANGHNTQPWRFEAGPGRLAIRPDFTRRTPVVDPDDHHLWASLGCAAENLALAARARGRSGEIVFAGDGLIADLAPGPAKVTPLFAAIPARQSTRAAYDGSRLSPALADALRAEAALRGVDALWIDAPDRVEAVLALILDGNARQMADPAFVAELETWLRFNAGQAARTGDGLFSVASGNPSLPAWAGERVFDLVFREPAERQKYTDQVRSSAGLLVLVADRDAPEGWVAAGRACQRVMLRATAEGLRAAFVNQAVEVPGMRAELRALLGLADRRPNLLLRIGRGPAMPPSLRRPVAEVLA